jgi:hypothetical protein
VEYYRRGLEAIHLDITLNHWHVDDDLHQLLKLDELQDNDTVLFEPYYDPTGRLTDTDDLPNSWELKYGLDIYSNNADEDQDDDGLTNHEEYLFSVNETGWDLDPTSNDTDGDGMDDKWEIDHGLKPCKNDSRADIDHDGYTNLEEYFNGTDPEVPDPKDNDDDSYSSKEGPFPLFFIAWITILVVIVLVLYIIVSFFRRSGNPVKKRNDVVDTELSEDGSQSPVEIS